MQKYILIDGLGDQLQEGPKAIYNSIYIHIKIKEKALIISFNNSYLSGVFFLGFLNRIFFFLFQRTHKGIRN